MMKQWTKIVTLALCLSIAAMGDEFKEKARKINSLYKAGITAMNKGDIENARKSFNAILKIHPNHGHARYQLGRLESARQKAVMSQRKANFTKTKLAKIDIEDATVREAFETLNILATQASEKKFSPNFLIQDPAGQFKDKRITLRLSNVPLAAAMKYTMEQAGAMVSYEQHATVIRPRQRVTK